MFKLAILMAVFGLSTAGVIDGGAGGGVGVVAVDGGAGGGIPAGAGVGPDDDVPSPKSQVYNVPSVSKVSLPGQQQTRSVETYSAPSIEKTTTITRSITAPLNAPAQRFVQYSAPAGPVVGPAGPAISYVGGFGAGGGGFAPALAGYAALGGQTVYASPSLGYNIGAPALAYAAAPAIQYARFAAAPVALAAAPVLSTSYGAPAAAATSGGYSSNAVATPSNTYGAPSS